jgi:hypothetical protein
MRENRTYGSEGGEAKAFPTPIVGTRSSSCKNFCDVSTWMPVTSTGMTVTALPISRGDLSP